MVNKRDAFHFKVEKKVSLKSIFSVSLSAAMCGMIKEEDSHNIRTPPGPAKHAQDGNRPGPSSPWQLHSQQRTAGVLRAEWLVCL